MIPCRYVRFDKIREIKEHAMRISGKVIADIPEIRARWKDRTLGYTTLYKLVKAYCQLDAESPDWMHKGYFRRLFWDEAYENVVFSKEMAAARVFRFTKTAWGIPFYVRQLKPEEETWLEKRANEIAQRDRNREAFLDRQAEKDQEMGLDPEDRAWLRRCKITLKDKISMDEVAAKARMARTPEEAREFVETLIDCLRVVPAPKRDMRGRWDRKATRDSSSRDDV